MKRITTFLTFLWISMFLIGTSHAASNYASFRISVTIPAIPGLNAPALDEDETTEEFLQASENIIETEIIEEIVLNTPQYDGIEQFLELTERDGQEFYLETFVVR